MLNMLLATKLYIPQVRGELIARPRLIARLNEGLGYHLIVVSAPPGFGKTTLLSAWIRQRRLPTAWLSLDSGDNDLARFLAYLVAALQTVKPELPAFQTSASLELALVPLINQVAAIPGDFVLVLDDYHVIESQPVHNALNYLIDHAPPQLHLVVSSRTDPPFPLARLRGRGQLIELRQRDLRFTADETALFLNQIMGLGLAAEEVIALEAQTEGWIGGLQLAALSMQGRSDLAGFVRAFTGSHVFVAEYLVEEVLQRQPEAMQFVQTHQATLSRKPFAAFLVCMTLALKHGDYREHVADLFAAGARAGQAGERGLFCRSAGHPQIAPVGPEAQVSPECPHERMVGRRSSGLESHSCLGRNYPPAALPDSVIRF